MLRRILPVFRTNAGTDFFNDPAKFMTNDDRFVTLAVHDVTLHLAPYAFAFGAAVDAFVGAADGGGQNANLYIVETDCRLGRVRPQTKPVFEKIFFDQTLHFVYANSFVNECECARTSD